MPTSNTKIYVETRAIIQTNDLKTGPLRSSSHCLDSKYMSDLLDNLEDVEAATFIIEKWQDRSSATFADVFSIELSLIKTLEKHKNIFVNKVTKANKFQRLVEIGMKCPKHPSARFFTPGIIATKIEIRWIKNEEKNNARYGQKSQRREPI